MTLETPLLRSHQPQNYLPEQIVYGAGAVGSLGFACYQWLTSSEPSSEWKATLATAGVFATSLFGFVRACQHKNSEARSLGEVAPLQIVTTTQQAEPSAQQMALEHAQGDVRRLEAALAESKQQNTAQQQQIKQLSTQIARITSQDTPSPAPNDPRREQTLDDLLSDTDSKADSNPPSLTSITRALPFTKEFGT